MKRLLPSVEMSACARFLHWKLRVYLTLTLLLFCNAPVFSATWQADFNVRVFSPRTKTILFDGKIYVSGLKVRIEAKGSDEINLYDFERSVSFRVFPVDQIYFEKPLSAAKITQGIKEGWIPASDPFHETKVLLKKGDFKGRAGRLTLIILENKGRKSHLLRWETDDVHAIPLRVIYPGSANETIVIDYNLLPGEISPSKNFDPPADYLGLNPF